MYCEEKTFCKKLSIYNLYMPPKYQTIYNDYLKGNNNAESDKYIEYIINGYKEVKKDIIFKNKKTTEDNYYCCICMTLYNNKKVIHFNCGHYCCLGCFLKIKECHLCKKKINEKNIYYSSNKNLLQNYKKYFYKNLIKKYGIKLILLYDLLKLPKNQNKKILIINNNNIFNKNFNEYNKLFYKLTNFNIVNDLYIEKTNVNNILCNFDLIFFCDITYESNIVRKKFLNNIDSNTKKKNKVYQLIIKNTIEEKISKNLLIFFSN